MPIITQDTGPSRLRLEEYSGGCANGHTVVRFGVWGVPLLRQTEGPEALRPIGEVEIRKGVGAFGVFF